MVDQAGEFLDLRRRRSLKGLTVAVAYSGGPDATALAARLQGLGAQVIPVYVMYRNRGGKTVKDLCAALGSAGKLGLSTQYLEAPLVRPISGDAKSRRNRIILATMARMFTGTVDALAIGSFQERCEVGGLWTEQSNNDLEPARLLKSMGKRGLDLITWDSFGATCKADGLKGLSGAARDAVFATTSCQMWWKVECGNCYSCLERHQAFIHAFSADPTKYRPKCTVSKRQAAAAATVVVA